jgi:hypothetical protein
MAPSAASIALSEALARAAVAARAARAAVRTAAVASGLSGVTPPPAGAGCVVMTISSGHPRCSSLPSVSGADARIAAA